MARLVFLLRLVVESGSPVVVAMDYFSCYSVGLSLHVPFFRFLECHFFNVLSFSIICIRLALATEVGEVFSAIVF